MSTVTSVPSGKDPDEKLTLQAVCKELKISRSTFYEWRQKQVAPPCYTLPNGQLRIVRRDFEMWLHARKDVS
ncbi:helix-turn-helix transcriptional regulator [Actinomadura sp. SCN-SB]|uniref:helix-turn-helix transcriptional regulator n=1 Tax=Actinomadura sp. SCN-SB TaxID=3373092 RepID=UPI003750326E